MGEDLVVLATLTPGARVCDGLVFYPAAQKTDRRDTR